MATLNYSKSGTLKKARRLHAFWFSGKLSRTKLELPDLQQPYLCLSCRSLRLRFSFTGGAAAAVAATATAGVR